MARRTHTQVASAHTDLNERAVRSSRESSSIAAAMAQIENRPRAASINASVPTLVPPIRHARRPFRYMIPRKPVAAPMSSMTSIAPAVQRASSIPDTSAKPSTM